MDAGAGPAAVIEVPVNPSGSMTSVRITSPIGLRRRRSTISARAM